MVSWNRTRYGIAKYGTNHLIFEQQGNFRSNLKAGVFEGHWIGAEARPTLHEMPVDSA